MIRLQIRMDSSAAKAMFGDALPKALPYVKAATLTRLASGGRDEIRKRMPVDFDRPTPYTVRGVFVKSASASSMRAEVYVPESASMGGKAAREYLQPGVAGTPKRRQKRTEHLLWRMGYLPSGWLTTPGRSAEKLGMIDQYGNLRGRIYAQVINVLQLKRSESKTARGVSARSQARAKRMGVSQEWFAVQPGKNRLGKRGSWLPPGVYRRAGKQGQDLQQILKFVQRAAYRPRLDFDGTVQTWTDKQAQSAWDAAMQSVAARFAAKK